MSTSSRLDPMTMFPDPFSTTGAVGSISGSIGCTKQAVVVTKPRTQARRMDFIRPILCGRAQLCPGLVVFRNCAVA